jgi:hypothetical protein
MAEGWRLVDGERLQCSTQGLDDAVAFGAGNDQRRAQRKLSYRSDGRRRARPTMMPWSRQKIDDATNLGRIELLLG